MEKRSSFVSVPDLSQRWCYTPQGARKLVKSPGFPLCFCTVSNGRLPLWILGDVIDWEEQHPEVYDEGAKIRKQKGYFRAKLKGVDGSEPTPEAQP